jgi:Domain of unknown function (DUF4328)
MADRQRDPDWWIASDGKWYPPDLRTEEAAFAPDTWEPREEPDLETALPSALTRIIVWGLVAVSVVLLVAAFVTFQYSATIRSSSDEGVIEDARLVADGWAGFAFLGMFVVGALFLAWTFRTSRIMDARGATGRRWRGGWTIGSWFAPFASLLLPRFVFAELEKIAQIPYRSEPIGDTWKSLQRSPLGDLWWLLWVGSLVALQFVQILTLEPIEDGATLAVVVAISAIGYATLAGAGVSLALVVRGIDRSSRS